jgi:uncharacterized membrane protein
MHRLFGPTFVVTGILHFVIPKTYEAIMPPYLPRHRELVYASGVAEIASGALLTYPPTRKAGMIASILTLIGVFPANLHMAIEADKFGKRVPGGAVSLYCRLPIQLLFIYWAWKAGTEERD